MMAGRGQALFAAECSHSFHFHSIASSVKHEEQRDFLLFLNVLACDLEEEETSLVKVDRKRNRIQAAKATANARAYAELNDLAAAVSILEKCSKELKESVSFRAGDNLCIALDAELKGLREKMTSGRLYDSSGRALMLSGMSSHSWDRATTREDSIKVSTVGQAYVTPSMAGMVSASPSMPLGPPNVTTVPLGAPNTSMPLGPHSHLCRILQHHPATATKIGIGLGRFGLTVDHLRRRKAL